jgi:drug/metabolite transporter (DMT)-like permease
LPPQALPYILLLGFLFGSSLVASRFSVGQFQPVTYIGIRLVLASLCYVATYTFVRRRTWPRSASLWKRAALQGVFGTAIPMVTVISSLQFQSAGLTSVLMTASPAVTVLLAHFFLPDESLTPMKGAGVSLALGGAVLLVMLGESGLPGVSQANPLGYGLVALGILSGSSMTIYARKYMRNYDFFDVSSVRMFTAALVVMPLSALMVGVDLSGVDGRGCTVLLYAALAGTFIGQMLSFYSIKRFGATAASMPMYIIPVVATLGGALLLGERITGGMLVGMTLIAAGIALITNPAMITSNRARHR